MFERTNELAAAAAVLAMDVEPDGDEELEQEASCGASVGDLLQRPARKPSAAGKKNQSDPPEPREARTDIEKVSMLP